MKSSPRTLIIAEAGVNHNGELALAHQLIDAAKAAGADVVKFQSFVSELLVSSTAPKAAYQHQGDTQGDTKGETQYAMLKRLELSPEAHTALQAHCQQVGLAFLSTPFDAQSIQLLKTLGLTRVKIGSGDLTNTPYLQQIARTFESVILSTGMATLGEIEQALQTLENHGLCRSNITLLHANSAYPTPLNDVHLHAMQTLKTAFGCAVGYSDHTVGTTVPIAAVALGATVIEKHLTLDTTLPGPDHAASATPEVFTAMVQGIREVELALGSPLKQPTPSELENRPVARKGMVALRPIAAGERLSDANVTTRRPEAEGLPAHQWDAVLGGLATQAYHAGDPIVGYTREDAAQ
ncbi:MAG: N-acetylneuraminate synthase [Vampirovibrionales bacterium]